MTDKVICPWCGAEMFHPRPWQKGQPDMGGYNWTVQAKCRECGALSPKVYGRTEQEAENKMFAAALRRYTPPIKPMSFEEVERLVCSASIDDETPMYLEDADGDNGWHISWQLNYLCRVMKNDYGRTWRCWPRKPTKGEMEAAEWER